MVIAEASPAVFKSDEMLTPEQKAERLKGFADAVFALCKDRTRSDAEKGVVLADAFSKLCQSKEFRAEAISKARQIFEIVANAYKLDARVLIAGLLGEIASADLLESLDDVDEVDYPELNDDLTMATDWKIKTSDGKIHPVQTKTIGMMTEREDMGKSALPVLSSVNTIDDLKNFYRAVEKISDQFVVLLGNHIVKIDDFGQNPLNLRQLSFSIIPDSRFYNVPSVSQGRNRLEDLCYQAARMHILYQESEEKPMMCLLGSANYEGSDINKITGEPRTPARERAHVDLKKVLQDDIDRSLFKTLETLMLFARLGF
ncbi:MAG: hypothetical protein WCP91_03980, partial [Candidatus Berkelbacteria bacterium]